MPRAGGPPRVMPWRRGWSTSVRMRAIRPTWRECSTMSPVGEELERPQQPLRHLLPRWWGYGVLEPDDLRCIAVTSCQTATPEAPTDHLLARRAHGSMALAGNAPDRRRPSLIPDRVSPLLGFPKTGSRSPSSLV